MECGPSSLTDYLTILRRMTNKRYAAWVLFFAGAALPVSFAQGQGFTRPTYFPAVSESYFFGDSNEVYPNPYQPSPPSFVPSPGETRPVPDHEVRARERAERRENIRKKYLTADSPNFRKPEKERISQTEVLYRDENTVVYRTSPEVVFPGQKGQLVPSRIDQTDEDFSLWGNPDGTTSALPIQEEVQDNAELILEDVSSVSDRQNRVTETGNELGDVILEDVALPAENDILEDTSGDSEVLPQKNGTRTENSLKPERFSKETAVQPRLPKNSSLFSSITEAPMTLSLEEIEEGGKSVDENDSDDLILWEDVSDNAPNGKAVEEKSLSGENGLEAVSENEDLLELVPAPDEEKSPNHTRDQRMGAPKSRSERSILKTSGFRRDAQIRLAAFKFPFQEDTEKENGDGNELKSGNGKGMRYPVRGSDSSRKKEQIEKEESVGANTSTLRSIEASDWRQERTEYAGVNTARVSTRNHASGVRIQELVPQPSAPEMTPQRFTSISTFNVDGRDPSDKSQYSGSTQKPGVPQYSSAGNSETAGKSPMIQASSSFSSDTAGNSRRNAYPVPKSYVDAQRISQNSGALRQNNSYSAGQKTVSYQPQSKNIAQNTNTEERSILVRPPQTPSMSEGQSRAVSPPPVNHQPSLERENSQSRSVPEVRKTLNGDIRQNSYPKPVVSVEPAYVAPFPEKNTANHKLKFVIPERLVFEDFRVRKTIEKGSLPWYAEYIQDLDVNEEQLFNALRVLGNNKLSQSRSRFQLMEAGIIASRSESAAEANRIFNIYENIEYYVLQSLRGIDARQDLTIRQKEEMKAEAILNFMHQNVIQEYRLEGTTMRNLLEHGRYNCVTASILFCSLAEKAGLNVTAVELPGHAMCWVYLSDGERLEVETTCDTWFKYRNDPETQKKVICKLIRDASPQMKDQSDQMLLSQVPQPISDKRLIAKIYYNRGVDLLAINDYAGALEANAIAYCLDPQSETTFGNLLATMNNWAIALCKDGDYAAASNLLKMGLKHKPDYPPFRNNHTHVYHYWVRALYEKGQVHEALRVADIAADEQPEQKRHFHELQNQIRQTIAVESSDSSAYR